MKILVCPLNWGLGHATRCVPVIKKLTEEDHEVIIATDGFPLQFLRQEFPQLSYIDYPSYKIRYSEGKSQIGAMIRYAPGIIRRLFAEHRWLWKLVKNKEIDMVISDNRFGLWNKHIRSVYITHQLMIKMPRNIKFLEPVVHKIHRFFINRYAECWIPDVEGKNSLSGDLSHKYKLPKHARFIGVLSRFDGLKDAVKPDTRFQIVCLLSGVEPQRTIFEQLLIERFKDDVHKVLILQGLPQAEKQETKINNITKISHLETNELVACFLGADKIVSRSGYSTIMDLYSIGCLDKAEFIPTPGQTEQEYLAAYFEKNRKEHV